MKPMIQTLSVLLVLSALSACSANRYCARSQSYDRATSIPPLVGTDTLHVPTTTTALKVPESKVSDPLTFGYVTPDPERPGKTKVECLDRPPPIPPIADASK